MAENYAFIRLLPIPQNLPYPLHQQRLQTLSPLMRGLRTRGNPHMGLISNIITVKLFQRTLSHSKR